MGPPARSIACAVRDTAIDLEPADGDRSVMGRRYVVLGVGAIGGAIAALLRLAGANVLGIARGKQLAALRAAPLLLETPSRSERVAIDVVDSPAAARLAEGDVLVLCTKSQHAQAALEAARAAAPPGMPVVCAQNGVATERIASASFESLYGMVVFVPASHLEPGRVTLHSEPVLGVLDVGVHPSGVDTLCEEVAGDLARAGFEARAEPEILRLKYGKLLTNVGNVLQALAGQGALPLAQAVQDEAMAVYRAARIDFAPMDELRRRWGHIAELPVGGAPRGGGSTWQSLARGTGDIETDFLNGEIVALAESAGVDAPQNRRLVELARRAACERWPPGRMTPAELSVELSA